MPLLTSPDRVQPFLGDRVRVFRRSGDLTFAFIVCPVCDAPSTPASAHVGSAGWLVGLHVGEGSDVWCAASDTRVVLEAALSRNHPVLARG